MIANDLVVANFEGNKPACKKIQEGNTTKSTVYLLSDDYEKHSKSYNLDIIKVKEAIPPT